MLWLVLLARTFSSSRMRVKSSFKDEFYHREKRGDNIRRKRQQKERERQKMTKESELDNDSE